MIQGKIKMSGTMKKDHHKGKIVRTFCLALSTVLLLSFCGCGLFSSLDLTEEQSGLVAEYAAGLLKKYNRDGARLMNPDAVKEAEAEEEPEEQPEEPAPEEAEPTPEAEPAAEGEEPSFEDLSAQESAEDLGVEDLSEEESTFSVSSIAECLGLEGIDVVYRDYEICDTYPDQPDNSWLISMSAREGKKLVVVKFDITNQSGEDVSCDILNAGKQYRLVVNNEKKIKETVTVLMDSFSQFNGTITPGGTEETVLIFELDEGLVESVNSLSLIVKDSAGSETFKLL